MTLPSPGVPLSLSQIKGEFGGPANTYGLGNYYAGGTYVPAGTTGAYGPIPSSGPISIRDFYGATDAVLVNIVNNAYYTGLPDFFAYIGFSTLWGTTDSVTPSTLKGVAIRQLFQDTTPGVGPKFYVQLAAVVSQNFWTSVKLTPGTTLYSSAATFTTQSTPVIWSTWTFNYSPGWAFPPSTATAEFSF